MKKALQTANERDHQLVAEITALRAENKNAQPTLEHLRSIDRVLIDQARERLSKEAEQKTNKDKFWMLDQQFHAGPVGKMGMYGWSEEEREQQFQEMAKLTIGNKNLEMALQHLEKESKALIELKTENEKKGKYTQELQLKLIEANGEAAEAFRGKADAITKANAAGEKSTELQKTVDMYNAQAVKLEELAAKPLETAQEQLKEAQEAIYNDLARVWQTKPASKRLIKYGSIGNVEAVKGRFIVQNIGKGMHVLHTLAEGVKPPAVGAMTVIKGGQVFQVKTKERTGLSR